MQSMAITRLPGENFRGGITSAGLGPPDYNLALRQHAAYREALEMVRLAPSASNRQPWRVVRKKLFSQAFTWVPGELNCIRPVSCVI